MMADAASESHAAPQGGLTLVEVLAAAAVVALVAAATAPIAVRISSATRSSGELTRDVSDLGAFAYQLSVPSPSTFSCTSPPPGITCTTVARNITLDRHPWSARITTNPACQGNCSMPTSRLTADIYQVSRTSAPSPALRVASPGSP